MHLSYYLRRLQCACGVMFFRLCFDPQMTGGVEHIGQHVT